MRQTVKSTARREPVRALLARNLVALRAAKSWTQEDLALEAGVHRTFVTQVEKESRNITLDSLEKFAVALGVEVFELLGPRPPSPER